MKILQRIAIWLTCLLMVVAMAVVKDQSLLGHNFHEESTVAQADSLACGFGGPVPVQVYVSQGRIDSIRVLENSETPDFLERAKAGILPPYVGKTVDEALALQVDVVSGATYSSRALKENIHRSLAEMQPETADGVGDSPWSLSLVLALLLTLCAAVVPLFCQDKRYRMVQLLCNVVVVGFSAGVFVSYGTMIRLLAHGFGWPDIVLLVLILMAWFYPLAGKKGYYCAWACPLGSAQELMGQLSKQKLPLSPGWLKRLEWFRLGLWGVLMLLAWTGICLEWMDYELFSAFLWQSVQWGVLVAAGVVLVLSVFVNRPYCRFVCPTGTLLKSLGH